LILVVGNSGRRHRVVLRDVRWIPTPSPSVLPAANTDRRVPDTKDQSMRYDETNMKEPPAAASANGIVQCLRMLADEAASLRMTQTLKALRDALEICRAEGKDGQLHTTH
jgi:hypothetical protein